MPLDKHFGQFERSDDLSALERRVHELLVSKHRQEAIDLNDFADLYGKEVIAEDQAYIKHKRAEIEKLGTPPTKRAEIFEALIAEQTELSEWFGPEAMTIIPSEYDDLRNGVDIAVEFESDGGFKYAALGIDVTSSTEGIMKKLGRIKQHIKHGDLTKIKYFKSERNPFRGEMSEVPGLIIGASAKLIAELSELWLAAHNARNLNKEGLSEETVAHQRQLAREAQQKLADHRSKSLLLEELGMQLSVFSEYANKIGQAGIAARFRSIFEIIQSLRSDMDIPLEEDLKNQQDPVFQALQSALRQFDAI